MAMFYAVLVVCLSGCALGQVPGWGPCPDIVPMPNFEITKFMGKWYEARRSFTAFEFLSKCVTAEFISGEKDTVQVTGAAISSLTGKPSSIEVIGHVLDPDQPAELKVKIPSGPAAGVYQILGTDYDSYAVIYKCTNMELANFQYVWIMTREQNSSDDTIDKAMEIVYNYNLEKKWIMKTQQKDCEVELEEETDQPMTGLTEDNI